MGIIILGGGGGAEWTAGRKHNFLIRSDVLREFQRPMGKYFFFAVTLLFLVFF